MGVWELVDAKPRCDEIQTSSHPVRRTPLTEFHSNKNKLSPSPYTLTPLHSYTLTLLYPKTTTQTVSQTFRDDGG